MKLLLYCTKQPHKLYATNEGYVLSDFELGEHYKSKEKLNGKIAAECDYEVEKIIPINVSEDDYSYGLGSGKNLSKSSCLDDYNICEYLKDYNGNTIFKKGYAIHIKNLHIFDEPRELGKALIYNFKDQYIVDKAPQNMMKVYNRAGECHILISIRPEELWRILKGEQKIIVRKKVLKEMLNNEG